MLNIFRRPFPPITRLPQVGWHAALLLQPQPPASTPPNVRLIYKRAAKPLLNFLTLKMATEKSSKTSFHHRHLKWPSPEAGNTRRAAAVRT
jgi:hypothetical protein